MIEFVPAPDHVFAVRLSGTLTPDDIDRAVRELEGKLQRHRNISIFSDLSDFHDITAEALIKDFRYSFGKFGEWKRFPRQAVVTDKKWIRGVMNVLDPLLPQIDLKTFAPDERDRALAWASEVSAEVEPA
jgi:hypothetical protein